MPPGQALAIVAAGLAAGTVNTIVGSGSLITFPTLLAFGYPPVVANVTNTVGLVPGSVSGALGYRRELSGQRPRLLRLGVASMLGGLTGAVLLLVLPGDVFRTVVPVLILAACALVVVQPRLAARLALRRAAAGAGGTAAGAAASGARTGGPVLLGAVYLSGVYGGYFGAAQGVILVALLGIFVADDLQRLNAAKNVLAALVNGVAAVVFILASHVVWSAAGLLALGAVAGGQLGASVGRRFPAPVLRGAIVAVGAVVAVRLLV